MANKELALSLCKGAFQRDIALQAETLGSFTRKGKARYYESHYQKSIRNLLKRFRENNIPYEIVLGPKGGWYSAYLNID